jgi:hypothetical protein
VRLSRSLGEDDGDFPLGFLFFLSVKTDIAVGGVKSLLTIINRPFGRMRIPLRGGPFAAMENAMTTLSNAMNWWWAC